MTAAKSAAYISYEDYVRTENSASFKSEWINGATYAMAGGTMLHARLAMAVAIAIGPQLRGKPCVPYGSDLRVRSLVSEFAAYPDMTIVCGGAETHSVDKHACTNPTVVVEVLSPSTESFDRGDKAAHYRRMPSVQAYVWVSTSTKRIEVFTREANGTFVLSEAGPGESVHIAPIACVLAVDDVYAA
jgi:Uma2 family endonuclease